MKGKNNKNILIGFLILIIGILFFTIGYTLKIKNNEINIIKYECSPIAADGKIKKLDLDSILVKDLYNKVKTNVKEDINNPYFNESLKMYLAYRNIPHSKIYDSNCNLFIDNKMYSHTCEKNHLFNPKAFKEEDFELEYKKLYGVNAKLVHNDIQLGNSCLGGYQYIEKRAEYVKGYCNEDILSPFLSDKKIYNAEATGPFIYLYEKVKYIGVEGKNVPKELVSGDYKYTFKLDNNYNYILLNKELIIK